MTAAQDTFWVAHYAFNTINPLVEKAKAIEPSIQLSINATFGHEDSVFHRTHCIEAHIHWGREGMLALSTGLRNKNDVDRFAETLRAKIDKLRPLEAGIAA